MPGKQEQTVRPDQVFVKAVDEAKSRTQIDFNLDNFYKKTKPVKNPLIDFTDDDTIL